MPQKYQLLWAMSSKAIFAHLRFVDMPTMTNEYLALRKSSKSNHFLSRPKAVLFSNNLKRSSMRLTPPWRWSGFSKVARKRRKANSDWKSEKSIATSMESRLVCVFISMKSGSCPKAVVGVETVYSFSLAFDATWETRRPEEALINLRDKPDQEHSRDFSEAISKPASPRVTTVLCLLCILCLVKNQCGTLDRPSVFSTTTTHQSSMAKGYRVSQQSYLPHSWSAPFI